MSQLNSQNYVLLANMFMSNTLSGKVFNCAKYVF